MSILAQSGYGRGNKIEQGLSEGVINGLIMSPCDEKRDRLEQSISKWANEYPDTIILFDPQFYVSTLNTPRHRHLSEYDYYNENYGLSRTHFSGTRIHQYVQNCLDYQYSTFKNNVAYLVSPTILFDSFNDFWSQISLNMAVESMDYHKTELKDPRPLLLSIVVSETAFQTMEAMGEFLDALTELDVEGFYLIIRRNASSIQNAMEASSFARFLYFCYVLAEINEYKIIVGYCDWHSFLLHAMGVTHTASGWHQNLRQFSLERFKPSTVRRRPRKRYSSAQLLSCPLITPELQDIYLAGLITSVLSGSTHDGLLIRGPSSGEINWSDEISCLNHWFSLNAISQRVAGQAVTTTKIREVELIIQEARTLYLQLEHNGINFDTQTGPDHISEWLTAIREFRGISGI